MDRVVNALVNGRDCTLNYSVEVMFAMAEKFGTLQAALDLMTEDGPRSFETVRWFFIMMANDGELMRRGEGYTPQDMLTEADVTMRMKPIDFEMMKKAVSDAISAGYVCETKQPASDVDEGLQLLEQKKTETTATVPDLTMSQ